MGKISLTETEIDELLLNADMKINTKIRWKHKKNSNHFEFKIKIDTENEKLKGNLTLIGTKNKSYSGYSYALLFEKERVRGLDPNPTKTHSFIYKGKRHKTKGIHKHKYSDEIYDNYSYKPDDISEPLNLEKSFYEFLDECNIKFDGEFELPPNGQLELPV